MYVLYVSMYACFSACFKYSLLWRAACLLGCLTPKNWNGIETLVLLNQLIFQSDSAEPFLEQGTAFA